MQQGTRPSINLGPDTGILAEQLLRERERAEELNNRLNKSAKDLADSGQREAGLRTEVGQKEKEIALVRHEIKELQRKSELDAEARRKAEGERSDMRKRLEDEMNKRTREQVCRFCLGDVGQSYIIAILGCFSRTTITMSRRRLPRWKRRRGSWRTGLRRSRRRRTSSRRPPPSYRWPGPLLRRLSPISTTRWLP